MHADETQQQEAKLDRTTNYDRLLTEFGAGNRSGSEAIAYLESLGYSRSQARNAVYRFRQRKFTEHR